MKAKILEIFKSIQGEGPYTGVKQVFVRFFECNMHCTWCDTPNSIGDTIRHYKEMDVEDIFKQVKKLWHPHAHSVSLTGGEPLLQKNELKELIRLLKKEKIITYLDTNGTLPEALREIISGVDIISMDIKLPSSTKEKAYWLEHETFLEVAHRKEVFVKVVVSQATSMHDLKKAVSMVKDIDPKIIFVLQPNYFDMKDGSVKKCIEFEEYASRFLKDVRVMPQTHKFMKIP